MPGDVLGRTCSTSRPHLILTKGPIFAQLLLADEITDTAKTQSALLQR